MPVQIFFDILMDNHTGADGAESYSWDTKMISKKFITM